MIVNTSDIIYFFDVLTTYLIQITVQSVQWKYLFFFRPAICAKVFIALSIFFTYPLQFFVVIDIFTRYTEPHINEKYKTAVQISARALGVCLCGMWFFVIFYFVLLYRPRPCLARRLIIHTKDKVNTSVTYTGFSSMFSYTIEIKLNILE